MGTSTARISMCTVQYNTDTVYLRLTLDSTRRESEWKPSNSLAKKKNYELHLANTISLPDFDL